MVELGRFAQIQQLLADGWVVDAECRLIHARRGVVRGEAVIGGPSYMRSPNNFFIFGAVGGELLPVENQAMTLPLSIMLMGLTASQDPLANQAARTMMEMVNAIALGLGIAEGSEDRLTAETVAAMMSALLPRQPDQD